MKQCPVCKDESLKTREEELAKVKAQQVGEGVNTLNIARVHESWNLCSEICISCGYVR